jgi:hypothetical protein
LKGSFKLVNSALKAELRVINLSFLIQCSAKTNKTNHPQKGGGKQVMKTKIKMLASLAVLAMLALALTGCDTPTGSTAGMSWQERNSATSTGMAGHLSRGENAYYGTGE